MAIIKSIINGDLNSSVSINNRGLNYGDGVFETVAYINNTVILWGEHFERLSNGCTMLGIRMPKKSLFNKYIKQLITFTHKDNPYVFKVIVTRGESERGYEYPKEITPTIIITLSDYPKYDNSYWSKGVKLKLCATQLSIQPQLAGIKHLNRLEQVLARSEWANEYQEGIMLDSLGNVIEGVMSNLFMVNNNVVITPDLESSGVKGVVRGSVLNLCETHGIKCKVKSISLDELAIADEIFVTNSLIGIWPVRNIGGSRYSVGVTTKKIIKLLYGNHSVDYASINL